MIVSVFYTSQVIISGDEFCGIVVGQDSQQGKGKAVFPLRCAITWISAASPISCRFHLSAAEVTAVFLLFFLLFPTVGIGTTLVSSALLRDSPCCEKNQLDHLHTDSWDWSVWWLFSSMVAPPHKKRS